MVQRSLGTPDRNLAEALAAKEIADHKITVALKAYMNAKGTFDKQSIFDQTPNSTIQHEDGTISVATDKQIIRMRGHEVLDVKPNNVRHGVVVDASHDLLKDISALHKIVEPGKRRFDPDLSILELWIKQKGISGYLEREARATFQTFKSLTKGKLFQNADFEDGVALAEHFFAQGNKSATVAKKIGHLRAAVRLAMTNQAKKYPHLRFNPFSGVVAEREDAENRLMLDDNDMQLMAAHLNDMNDDERLLFVLCAGTGMGPKEAYQIKSEERHDGFRCVTIGEKSDARKRTIPLPTCVLPYLPKQISGPLFVGKRQNVTRNVNRAMNRFGIADQSKTLYSTRHRASYKLKGVQDSLRYEVLGHESRKKPAERYGRDRTNVNYPMKDIFKAINMIGLT